MAGTYVELGGNDLHVNDIYTGATSLGVAGTVSNLSAVQGVTAGTVAASKALIVDANKDISALRNITMAGTLTFNTAGGGLNLDSTTATLSSNAATITSYAAVITSEALTTAAGASQAFVITLTGVAAGDLAFVTRAGGTNTRQSYAYNAITTTNTITVTVYNNEPTNAINGTLIFNLWVVKQ